MTRLVDPSPDIAQAAAEWVIRRDRGLSPVEKADFEAWHSADPKHREEFARIASGWSSLDRLAPAPVLSAAADAVLLRVQARQSHRHVIVMAGGLLAAAACLALGAFLWLRPVAPSTGNYQVIASASREIHLPDGSLATLNGDSRIETDYTAAERRVRLVRGEALFTVAKNPTDPSSSPPVPSPSAPSALRSMSAWAHPPSRSSSPRARSGWTTMKAGVCSATIRGRRPRICRIPVLQALSLPSSPPVSARW